MFTTPHNYCEITGDCGITSMGWLFILMAIVWVSTLLVKWLKFEVRNLDTRLIPWVSEVCVAVKSWVTPRIFILLLFIFAAARSFN